MYPKAYIDYLVYFHSFRDYFECHEVLEEYWKEEGQKNKLWVGLIQVAVSMYHHRRNNFKGAEKQINKAIKILEAEKSKLKALGIDEAELLKLLVSEKNAIRNQMPYSPIKLPIKDKKIIDACIKNSQEKGGSWENTNLIVSDNLIHKHKLRDRSHIIEERLKRLREKRGD